MKRALVIDDDRNILTALQIHLEDLGMENGWVQELSSHLNYRPDFEKEQPF